jgi:hypothetical protein
MEGTAYSLSAVSALPAANRLLRSGDDQKAANDYLLTCASSETTRIEATQSTGSNKPPPRPIRRVSTVMISACEAGSWKIFAIGWAPAKRLSFQPPPHFAAWAEEGLPCGLPYLPKRRR